MTVRPPKFLIRAIAGVLAGGVLLAPALAASAGQAATSDPEYRKVSAPNTFYPVRGSSAVEDRVTFNARTHRGTDIGAPCGTHVYSSQPGIALVRTSTAWKGRYVVRVISNTDGLVTGYAYLAAATVQDGQVIQSGQMLGTVGAHPTTGRCGLYYTVYQSGVLQNPTTWLLYHVGQAPPVARLFDAPGINLASFNFLGASHTLSGGRFATYPSRTVRAVSLIKARGLDVIGAQELQKVQRDYFMRLTGGAYASFNWKSSRREDTDNSIIWNTATMELVSTSTYTIPYFGGNLRNVPVVELRQRATGRTAYFLNVHNPADVRGPAARYRAQAVAIERAKIIALRATGRPVFLTGDFNDRQEAFCPLTAGKLTISPNSVPSMTCLYPAQNSIDWIFAAGQTRFSYFNRDTYPQTYNISDHPIVITRAHLQD